MTSGIGRTLAILAAMAAGMLVPQAHVLAGGIRWLVMAMLFLVFVQTRLSRLALTRSHFVLLAANVVLGLAGWALGWAIGGRTLALAGFFAAITPTATAAPVVMSFLRGRVDYVIAAFLLTNLAIPALLPLLMPPLLGEVNASAFAHVLGSVAFVVFAPMAAGLVVRRAVPGAAEWAGRRRTFSFLLWVASLFLICANASAFIRGQVKTPLRLLGEIALTTGILCAANFAVGALIGGKEYRREGAQSLGQKNTTFTIYLALAHAGPVVALGPTCYVVWHNLWNSWQLQKAGGNRTAEGGGQTADDRSQTAGEI